MRHWQLTRWCGIAAKRIRYTPDREAVFKELLQHLDDRSDDFLEKGLGKEEAVEKTLEVMGSPDELAPMLAAIHRPFWGYAYSVTKIAAAVLCIAFTLFFAVNVISNVANNVYQQPYYAHYAPYTDTSAEEYYRIGLYDQTDCFVANGYTFRLSECAIWKESGTGEETLHLQIRVTNYLPWSITPNIGNFLQTTDGLGRTRSMYIGAAYHTAPFTWVYETWLTADSFESVKWIDIRYDRDGTVYTLHADLTGGNAK